MKTLRFKLVLGIGLYMDVVLEKGIADISSAQDAQTQTEGATEAVQ